MRFAPLLLLGLLLAGCDPFARPESLLEEYNRRLARVLDVEARLTPVPEAPRLPRLRERSRHVEPFNASLLDFLRLYGCDLQQVVGERNSILGRVAHPLTRLDLDRRFLLAAEACLPTLEREALAERVAEAVAHKREALPDVAWNAVWSSREIEGHFARSRGALPLALDPDRLGIAVQNAALARQRLTVLLDGGLDTELFALDSVYQHWGHDPLAGQALLSAVLVQVRLDDATALIERRLHERPLCPRGRPTRQAENVRGVFDAVYVARVQRYLAEVQRVRRELFPALLALAKLGHGSPSRVFDAYLHAVLDESNPSGYWQAFDAAIARHTAAWQALLEQCGMRPGSARAAAGATDPSR